MKRRVFSIIAAVALLSGLLVGALPAQASPPLPDYEPFDAGPQIRDWPATADMIAPPDEADAGATTLSDPAECIQDTKIFLILNNYLGRYQATYFNLMADGEHAQIWVQANLGWPTGDPRPAPVITCEQAEYMLGQFEDNILPKETDFFRAPDEHDGSGAYLPGLLGLPSDYYYDAAGRTVILVENVRDDNYYNPAYPLYIAGFYTSAYETYFDRNIISIDAYDWVNRTGPTAPRPYLYEGTFAHEYQHLLHDDADSDEETWVNEGCADFAQFLCGYGHPDSHVAATISNPENSLVLWQDQGALEILSDYGHAYLWTLYLNDKFGSSLIQAVFNNEGNGIAGVNAALQGAGIDRTFADLYTDWAAALLIDSATPGDGRYQFDSIDLNVNMGTPEDPNEEAFATPGAPPWGTDYLWITGNPKDLLKLKFNGVPYSVFPTAWSSDGNVLWGGTGNEVDNWAIFEATGGGRLTFDTKYDIEEYWDFGFVQVSTDGGHTWTSLANEYTTTEYDPNAYPTVKANVPGLTGSSSDLEGAVDGWINMSFDLGAYAGQDILVAFRYVTDWATTEAGWFIDNVYVDDELISDGSSADVFHDLTDYLPINNNFIVTFVGFKSKGKGNPYSVATLKLSDVTEEGLFQLSRVLKDSNKVAMLVTFAAPQGFKQYADYSYEFGFKSKGPKK